MQYLNRVPLSNLPLSAEITEAMAQAGRDLAREIDLNAEDAPLNPHGVLDPLYTILDNGSGALEQSMPFLPSLLIPAELVGRGITLEPHSELIRIWLSGLNVEELIRIQNLSLLPSTHPAIAAHCRRIVRLVMSEGQYRQAMTISEAVRASTIGSFDNNSFNFLIHTSLNGFREQSEWESVAYLTNQLAQHLGGERDQSQSNRVVEQFARSTAQMVEEGALLRLTRAVDAMVHPRAKVEGRRVALNMLMEGRSVQEAWAEVSQLDRTWHNLCYNHIREQTLLEPGQEAEVEALIRSVADDENRSFLLSRMRNDLILRDQFEGVQLSQEFCMEMVEDLIDGINRMIAERGPVWSHVEFNAMLESIASHLGLAREMASRLTDDAARTAALQRISATTAPLAPQAPVPVVEPQPIEPVQESAALDRVSPVEEAPRQEAPTQLSICDRLVQAVKDFGNWITTRFQALIDYFMGFTSNTNNIGNS